MPASNWGSNKHHWGGTASPPCSKDDRTKMEDSTGKDNELWWKLKSQFQGQLCNIGKRSHVWMPIVARAPWILLGPSERCQCLMMFLHFPHPKADKNKTKDIHSMPVGSGEFSFNHRTGMMFPGNYPPVIKHGVLENPCFSSMIFPARNLHSGQGFPR